MLMQVVKNEQMAKKKDKVIDIFEEASLEVVNEINETNKPVVFVKEVNINQQNISNPNAKNWNELKKAMDNEHAERFNNILHALPDREFVRVYLKAMEFFKPKVVRTKADRPAEDDRTINIQINNYNAKE